MRSKSDISDREAALLAAARQEVAGRAAPSLSPRASPSGSVSGSPQAATPVAAAKPAVPKQQVGAEKAGPDAEPVTKAAAAIVATPARRDTTASSADTIMPLAPVVPLAQADVSARMALLIEAEREANQLRKQRLHRRTLIGLSVLIVPMFLYVIGTLVSILGR